MATWVESDRDAQLSSSVTSESDTSVGRVHVRTQGLSFVLWRLAAYDYYGLVSVLVQLEQ